MLDPQLYSLEDKKGLVLGVANRDSIAYGCALAFRERGADLALTYFNDKAKKHVAPIAKELEASILMPCNVNEEGALEAVFDAIEKKWGRLDFALHAIAFAPKMDLQGRLVDCSLDGFLTAMDTSCHSFLRMARLAEPLMKGGGTLFTLSFYGATRVVKNYNVMGPVKAALESAVRYLAYELGPQGIRVHAISPGPIQTRAASGLRDFDEMMSEAAAKAPTHQLASIHDVGRTTAALATDSAKLFTGETLFVDGGHHIMA